MGTGGVEMGGGLADRSQSTGGTGQTREACQSVQKTRAGEGGKHGHGAAKKAVRKIVKKVAKKRAAKKVITKAKEIGC
jgi:hypothetical protein